MSRVVSNEEILRRLSALERAVLALTDVVQEHNAALLQECTGEPGEDCPAHPITEENQFRVSQEESDKFNAAIDAALETEEVLSEN